MRLPLQKDIYRERGFWKVHWQDHSKDDLKSGDEPGALEMCIGRSSGPDRLTKQEAHRIARERFVNRMRANEAATPTDMTVLAFIETVFVPYHVHAKKLAGRAYYQSILKHVIRPEEVERIFRVPPTSSKAKLTTISGWPYLSDQRLQDCGTESVQRLVLAAQAEGYTAQTITHIRNVVSAMFSCAIRLHHYQHENPARNVRLPEGQDRDSQLLTLSQVRDILRAMRYPEKEMTLIAMLTNMNVTEICGLQWKYVNLSGARSNFAGEPIPPITLAVRKQWYRGDLEPVKKARARNLPIPELLLPILIKLNARDKWTGPDDFVLVSRAGTPINAINLTARRLRTIGNDLHIPRLTWHVFRRGLFALKAELGARFHSDLEAVLHPERAEAGSAYGKWRGADHYSK